MMSYDPSSLNRNKTLLEAIEEVKKFLIANPCYKVFYANTNYVGGTTTYSKTYIDDPDSIAEYDVVFFDNNYYGKVESVGDSTFTIIGATNFKGDQGTQGDPGTPGANGVSITNVSIDASKHLICTLSDGTSIDAGEIPTIIHYAQVSNPNGTLTDSQYSQVLYRDAIIDYAGTILQKYSEDVNEIIFQCLENDLLGGITKNLVCTITKLTKAYTIVEEDLKIADDSINSESATSGQVLTADGTGGASWETPSGAGFDNYVEINTTSGTFTDDEYAKLVFNDSVIVYDNGTYKTIYKKKIETSSIIEFESIDASARQNLKLIDVNKGTKAFSSTGISMITSSTFDSGAATSGKVLTANGSGGTSWETAGGYSTYSFTSTAGNNAQRIRLYNILKNSKAVRYLECRTYAIPCTFSSYFGDETSFKISGTNYYSGGVSIYELILTSSGSLSGNKTEIKTDGTVIQSTISYNDYAFKVSYINDTEITA